MNVPRSPSRRVLAVRDKLTSAGRARTSVGIVEAQKQANDETDTHFRGLEMRRRCDKMHKDAQGNHDAIDYERKKAAIALQLQAPELPGLLSKYGGMFGVACGRCSLMSIAELSERRLCKDGSLHAELRARLQARLRGRTFDHGLR